MDILGRHPASQFFNWNIRRTINYILRQRCCNSGFVLMPTTWPLGCFARGRPRAIYRARFENERDLTFRDSLVSSWKRDRRNLNRRGREGHGSSRNVRLPAFWYGTLCVRWSSGFNMAWVPLESNPEVSELPRVSRHAVARAATERPMPSVSGYDEGKQLQPSRLLISTAARGHGSSSSVADVKGNVLTDLFGVSLMRNAIQCAIWFCFCSSSTNWAFQRNGRS